MRKICYHTRFVFCFRVCVPDVMVRDCSKWPDPHSERSRTREGFFAQSEVARNYFKLKKAYVAALNGLKK